MSKQRVINLNGKDIRTRVLLETREGDSEVETLDILTMYTPAGILTLWPGARLRIQEGSSAEGHMQQLGAPSESKSKLLKAMQ